MKKLLLALALFSNIALGSSYFGTSGGTPAIPGPITNGIDGSVLFVDPTATLAQDNANFFYSASNHQLTLGVAPIITPFSTAGVVHNSALGLLSSSLVSLTADVSGLLPIANGGTGASTTSQNFAFIGPTSGSGAPSFRAIVVGDIPTLNQNTTGTAANITASSNSTLTTLSALSLPATQLSGTIAAARLPALTGDITTTAGSVATTLATVNSNVGSFTNANVTVNAKGLVTAASNGSSSGTVTSVSVVGANGLAGTVATATTTPAITLSTTVTGVVKGNGTTLSAATAGTDYSSGTSALATGIVKSTTTTGALTIAVAGDFPTLNQSTTGNAANVTGTVAIANGGTGQVTANAGFNALSPMFALGGLIYGGTAGAATNLPGNLTTTLQFLAQTGTGSVSAAPRWVALSAPTTQTFTSGSGTYTTPPSALYIRVRLVGAGAGGAGSGTSPGAATAGGNTTFGSSLLVGNGGAINSGSSGGPGGSASLGSGPAGLAIQGGQGESVSTLANFNGGFGGASLLGGQASGGATSGNGQAGAQYGSGGGGAGSGAVGGSGPGGGAGGFVDVIITAPLGTYSYAVGAAGSSGTAGGSGFTGGAGTSGVIQVTEYYQ